ncbi:MAG: hypothetical protein ACOYCA_04420 [Eggerthellaceae bacterium]
MRKQSASDVYHHLFALAALALLFVAGGIFIYGGNLFMIVCLVAISSFFILITLWQDTQNREKVHKEFERLISYLPVLFLLPIMYYCSAHTFNVSGVFHINIPLICLDWPFVAVLILVLLLILTQEISQYAYGSSSDRLLTQAYLRIYEWTELVLGIVCLGMFFIAADYPFLVLSVVVMALFYILLAFTAKRKPSWLTKFSVKSIWLLTVCATAVNLILISL